MTKKQILFHQDNAPCHKPIKTMTQMHELHFELRPHPLYSADLATSDCWLFVDLKKMPDSKKFRSNEVNFVRPGFQPVC